MSSSFRGLLEAWGLQELRYTANPGGGVPSDACCLSAVDCPQLSPYWLCTGQKWKLVVGGREEETLREFCLGNLRMQGTRGLGTQPIQKGVIGMSAWLMHQPAATILQRCGSTQCLWRPLWRTEVISDLIQTLIALDGPGRLIQLHPAQCFQLQGNHTATWLPILHLHPSLHSLVLTAGTFYTLVRLEICLLLISIH